MTKLITILATLLCSSLAFAGSLYNVKVNGAKLYDRIIQQGVPRAAVERVFEFIDMNGNKTVNVKSKVRAKRTYMAIRKVKIKNRYAGIIDFTLPSDERRFYVMDLRTGVVNKYFVAHGKNSGVVTPSKFSNIEGSKMSSLGIYIAGNTYSGGHGESLNLYGIEETNSRAASRDIVMHSANYVSEDYAKAQGRLGRSWGCPAVSPGIIKKMIDTFEEGGVIYAFQKEAMAHVSGNPDLQEVTVDNDKDDVDLPDEEETLRPGQAESDKADNDDEIPFPMPRPSFYPKVAPVPQDRPASLETRTGVATYEGPKADESATTVEKIIETEAAATAPKAATQVMHYGGK